VISVAAAISLLFDIVRSAMCLIFCDRLMLLNGIQPVTKLQWRAKSV